MKHTQQEISSLKKQLSETKGFFKGKERKSLEIFYMCAGENIAAGFNTPKTAITAWMHSPGHRANILGTDYTSAAVGVYVSSDETCYWCLMLIGDC